MSVKVKKQINKQYILLVCMLKYYVFSLTENTKVNGKKTILKPLSLLYSQSETLLQHL